MKELLELLKAKVNRHGELHLNKEHTELVLKWCQSIEGTLTALNEYMGVVQDYLKVERRRFEETDLGEGL